MTPGVAQQRLGATITGEGERTIVFGNGIGTSQATWRHLVAAFASRARIVRYDNVCSPLAPPGGYREDTYTSLHAYVDDLVALLDELDVRDALFVGHSISGIIGLHAAVQAPERIARLALICSSARFLEDVDFRGGFSRDMVDSILADVQKDYPAFAEKFAGLAVGSHASKADLGEFHAVLGGMRPDIALRVFQQVFFNDSRALLRRVRQPVTVMQTRSDSMIPLSAGEYLVQQLPNATLLPLGSYGHVPQLTAPAPLIEGLTHILDTWS